MDRARGALLGLATGDAVGTTVEFSPRGSFPPVTDMTGGGPFRLKPGQWTDDTSMALCLAESLLERRGFDPRDQMERYLRWWRQGHMSVTGRCFDIGSTTAAALQRFETTGEPFSGDPSPAKAGNGSLMRLAPVAIFYAAGQDQAAHFAAQSSRTTHAAPQALDACAQFARMLVRALNGRGKEEILEPATSGFKDKTESEIHSSGYVLHTLEAALWCFSRAASFREGCLMAANLGDDSDTVAAVYGQIAGAYWGESGIPPEWLEKLAWADRIRGLAERLGSGV